MLIRALMVLLLVATGATAQTDQPTATWYWPAATNNGPMGALFTAPKNGLRMRPVYYQPITVIRSPTCPNGLPVAEGFHTYFALGPAITGADAEAYLPILEFEGVAGSAYVGLEIQTVSRTNGFGGSNALLYWQYSAGFKPYQGVMPYMGQATCGNLPITLTGVGTHDANEAIGKVNYDRITGVMEGWAYSNGSGSPGPCAGNGVTQCTGTEILVWRYQQEWYDPPMDGGTGGGPSPDVVAAIEALHDDFKTQGTYAEIRAEIDEYAYEGPSVAEAKADIDSMDLFQPNWDYTNPSFTPTGTFGNLAINISDIGGMLKAGMTYPTINFAASMTPWNTAYGGLGVTVGQFVVAILIAVATLRWGSDILHEWRK